MSYYKPPSQDDILQAIFAFLMSMALVVFVLYLCIAFGMVDTTGYITP